MVTFKYTFFVVILLNVGMSCSSSKHLQEPLENVITYCEFVEITEPFSMRIIDYIPCNTSHHTRITCVSNCIGVTNENDTIRVLSIVDTNSAFEVNETIRVIPEKNPEFEVNIAQNYEDEGDKLSLTSIQKRKLQTIYGKLIKI